MTKQTITANSVKAGLFRFLHRYHVLIFVISTIGGLSIATFMINTVLSRPSTLPGPTESQTFDTATIEQIRTLKKPGEVTEPLKLPAGRINPFK